MSRVASNFNITNASHLLATSYKEMLQCNFIPQLRADGVLGTVWWQQDGAPAHYAQTVRDYLNETFGDRWIGRGGPVHWPARSPDLNSLVFFLWGT